MKKQKIWNKITTIEQDVEEMETGIITLMSDPLNRDYPKVGKLCDGINQALNEIELLREFL